MRKGSGLTKSSKKSSLEKYEEKFEAQKSLEKYKGKMNKVNNTALVDQKR